MAFENGTKIEVFAMRGLDYLKGGGREEAAAAISAETVAPTLIHGVLATAYAKYCSESDERVVASGRAWVAEHRVW